MAVFIYLEKYRQKKLYSPVHISHLVLVYIVVPNYKKTKLYEKINHVSDNGSIPIIQYPCIRNLHWRFTILLN